MRTLLRIVVCVLLLSVGATVPGSAEHAGSSARCASAPVAASTGEIPARLGPLFPLERPGLTVRPSKAFDDTDLIDLCVESAMQQQDTPGVAVAVAVDGQLTYAQGYGVKKRGGDDPVTPQSVFRIGSVTKMMTAAALMQQVEAGRVGLDDPVTRLIPDFEIAPPWRADSITIRHLLTHQTGFPDRFFFIDGDTEDEALAAWVGNLGTVSLHAAPGAFWNYSNPNFMIAGLVVERASGQPYRTYVEQNVWTPAGMASTTFDPAEVLDAGDWTWGHYTDPASDYEFTFGPDDYDNASAAPAGYAFSTAADLVEWALLMMDGGRGVLSPDSAFEMQDRQVWMHYGPDQSYGFGVISEPFHGVELKQHGGNIPGWGTSLMWVPERGFAVAVLANTFEGLTQAAYCITDAVLDLEDAAPVDDTTDPSTWGRFAGSFDVVDVAGRRLTAEIVHQDSSLQCTVIPAWDPDEPQVSTMVQVYRDVFLADLDGDGEYEMDFTFIGHRGSPDPVIWLRHRQMVGLADDSARDGSGGGRVP